MLDCGGQKKQSFSITEFFSKCDQIRRLRIWSHLLKKSVMENIFVQCWHQILRGTISFSRSKSSNASLEVKEVLISDKKLSCLLKISGSQFSSLIYQGLVDISVKSIKL